MKKIGIAVATGCALTVLFLLLFRELKNSRDFNPATPSPKPPSEKTPALPSSNKHAASERRIAASELAPSSSGSAIVPIASAAASEVAEIVLPSPPSGDYDLNLSAEQIDAIVEQHYRKFFPTLSLAPDALLRLRALLAERQQVTIDAANAAVLFGLDPVRDLPATRTAIDQFQAAVDAKIRQEFGEAIFTRYRDFDRTLRERNAMKDLSRELAAVGEPLEPRQETAVLQILQSHPGENPPQDINRAIFGDLTTRAPISEPALAAATRVLSPRQLDVLRKLQRP